MEPIYSPLGDRAVRITFGNKLSEETNDIVTQMYDKIESAKLPYISEMVPGYVTLTIYYAQEKARDYHSVIQQLESIVNDSRTTEMERSKTRKLTIPVLYGGEKGPDLGVVAQHSDMSEEEVIQRHESSIYRVYMMGFAPGFPYLGGLDESIATPRRQTPRNFVAAGSVGIAGPQTGVYSIDSPGGWQIIGHTPVKLFNPLQKKPILLRAGDEISFQSVSEQEYKKIIKECEKGNYTHDIEWKEHRGGSL
ncbi:5-oxoprolinase subunit PxpB [Salipaludibacillus keqinensis]|uniref:5-oxoprolinase subunit PxpB n=1 Tax=Salipaludibacillus keqinensis TaxID=2045207 RepID=UPI001E393A04|nr:5-oxoprolinase subunit PxpB [Salipaludibacillus keqinensis]